MNIWGKVSQNATQQCSDIRLSVLIILTTSQRNRIHINAGSFAFHLNTVKEAKRNQKKSQKSVKIILAARLSCCEFYVPCGYDYAVW